MRLLLHALTVIVLIVPLTISDSTAQDSAPEAKTQNRKQNAAAQDNGRAYPPKFTDAVTHDYKTVGDVKLSLAVFNPKNHMPNDKRPAIVFFFGGGWQSGSPGQFEHQCRYLASRGLVAITADYRVASRHDAKVVDCIRDAKSAIRWVRLNAVKLGVDPDRIVASGGSAGGHLAAATATIDEFNESTDDLNVRAVPNALILFNPAVSFGPEIASATKQTPAQFTARAGAAPEAVSPAHHIQPDTPPTLILIGTEDFLLTGNRDFATKMKAAGRRCELDLYEGMAHGFFNYGRNHNTEFLKTLASADRFLASLHYVSGEPTVDEFFAGDQTKPAP